MGWALVGNGLTLLCGLLLMQSLLPFLEPFLEQQAPAAADGVAVEPPADAVAEEEEAPADPELIREGGEEEEEAPADPDLSQRADEERP